MTQADRVGDLANKENYEYENPGALTSIKVNSWGKEVQPATPMTPLEYRRAVMGGLGYVPPPPPPLSVVKLMRQDFAGGTGNTPSGLGPPASFPTPTYQQDVSNGPVKPWHEDSMGDAIGAPPKKSKPQPLVTGTTNNPDWILPTSTPTAIPADSDEDEYEAMIKYNKGKWGL
jgi:hypothetical protein